MSIIKYPPEKIIFQNKNSTIYINGKKTSDSNVIIYNVDNGGHLVPYKQV